MDNLPDPFTLSLILAALALVPFVAMMVTSFVKIAVVLSLVRNALGVQQVPPNMALYGLAIILTAYIMAPIGLDVLEAVEAARARPDAELREILQAGAEPLRTFLMRYSDPVQRDFFVQTTRSLWPEAEAGSFGEDNLLILVPAFTVSELTSAFEIGFLLYLPFIAVDLIVSNILLAMGMMMVSPMTISLPLKLFLFVMADGWSNLIQGLVLTYT